MTVEELIRGASKGAVNRDRSFRLQRRRVVVTIS